MPPGVPHPASGGLHGRAYAEPRGAGKSHRTPVTAVGSELEQAPNSGVFIFIIKPLTLFFEDTQQTSFLGDFAVFALRVDLILSSSYPWHHNSIMTE